MTTIMEAVYSAINLIVTRDQALVEIVALSLRVTLTAVAISCAIGLPLGAALGIFKFPGRGAITILLNSLMGLPPVVVGLAVYLLLSANGLFGPLQLLYTPAAMIIAQTVLVVPIIAALTRQVVADMSEEYGETLRSMRATRMDIVGTLLWDARFALLTAALAGVGRALAEVGAVMIVGGNINHVTRVMTTAIALETARGEIALALGLGIVLILLTIAINAAAHIMKSTAEKLAYA